MFVYLGLVRSALTLSRFGRKENKLGTGSIDFGVREIEIHKTWHNFLIT